MCSIIVNSWIGVVAGNQLSFMIAPYKHNTTLLAGAEKRLLMSLMKEGGLRERDENASGFSK
jgi:hypothetical protein